MSATSTAVARIAGLVGPLKRHKRIVQAAVLALIAVFLGASVARSWAQLTTYHWQVQWGLLAAAFALLVAQELSFAFIWRAILARMGSRLDVVASQRIYLGAELVRYIPGNVWHVITRVLWAERRGVPKATGFASMVVELATKITAAALVFALSLFFWPDTRALSLPIPRGALIAAGAVAVPLLLLGMQPRLLRAALNLALAKLGREPVAFSLRYGDVLAVTLGWAASWMLAGAGFYLLARALVATPLPPAALPIAIGIYAIGWDVGFLAFVTPSGLGFREVTLAFLLAQSGMVPAAAGAGLVAVIAILARLLSTAAELICIAAAYAAPGERRLARGDLARALGRDGGGEAA
jgi:glycosyltransferase 2 family protein